MSHFGKSGPPDVRDAHSLLILNVTSRTTAHDLFPLLDKYGKVVDVFIPWDRRSNSIFMHIYTCMSGELWMEERLWFNLPSTVQMPSEWRIVETSSKAGGWSRSRSPYPRYRDEYRDKDRDYWKRSCSGSRDRYDRDRYSGRKRDHHHQNVSHSPSPDHQKHYGRGRRS